MMNEKVAYAGAGKMCRCVVALVKKKKYIQGGGYEGLL